MQCSMTPNSTSRRGTTIVIPASRLAKLVEARAPASCHTPSSTTQEPQKHTPPPPRPNAGRAMRALREAKLRQRQARLDAQEARAQQLDTQREAAAREQRLQARARAVALLQSQSEVIFSLSYTLSCQLSRTAPASRSLCSHACQCTAGAAAPTPRKAPTAAQGAGSSAAGSAGCRTPSTGAQLCYRKKKKQ